MKNGTQSILKEGGVVYSITDTFSIKDEVAVLHRGYQMKECTDGYYEVYNEHGDKVHYRLSAQVVEQITVKKGMANK